MDTSQLPDNLPELLELCISKTTGDVRERFIAIRDAQDKETQTALFWAFRRNAFASERLADADRWLTALGPFFQPEVYIPLPPLS
jgi:hypothetical protein